MSEERIRSKRLAAFALYDEGNEVTITLRGDTYTQVGRRTVQALQEWLTQWLEKGNALRGEDDRER